MLHAYCFYALSHFEKKKSASNEPYYLHQEGGEETSSDLPMVKGNANNQAKHKNIKLNNNLSIPIGKNTMPLNFVQRDIGLGLNGFAEADIFFFLIYFAGFSQKKGGKKTFCCIHTSKYITLLALRETVVSVTTEDAFKCF